ncbi:MAG: hypothetical protein AAGF81_18235 [Pseudomonadota bacterium]
MQTSLFIAKLIGPMLVISGLIGLLNPRHMKAVGNEFLHSRALIFVAGAMAFIAGLAVINTHNVWAGWPLTITLLGWLMLTAGMVRMGFPSLVTTMGEKMLANNAVLRAIGTLPLALGAFLMWKGYL